jgi:hypothetical protein
LDLDPQGSETFVGSGSKLKVLDPDPKLDLHLNTNHQNSEQIDNYYIKNAFS